jgi:hypothetical protein
MQASEINKGLIPIDSKIQAFENLLGPVKELSPSDSIVDYKESIQTQIGDLQRIRANAIYYLSKAFERSLKLKESNLEESLPEESTSKNALKTLDTNNQLLNDLWSSSNDLN